MNAHSTVGFGCPNDTDPHHFTVEIPSGRQGFVVITEHYGIRAGINGRPELIERCRLPKAVWAQIAEHTKRHFNDRLKEKKLATSRWVTGINKVERLLGKELCVPCVGARVRQRGQDSERDSQLDRLQAGRALVALHDDRCRDGRRRRWRGRMAQGPAFCPHREPDGR